MVIWPKADDVEFVSLLGNQDLTVAAWLRTYYALKRKLQKKTMKKEEKEVERHLRWKVSAQGRQWIVRHNALVMVINTHANPNLFKTDYLWVLEF